MDTTLEITPFEIEANRLDLVSCLADQLAHDMRNPLNSAVINIELLRRRIECGQTDGALERLTALERDIGRIHSLTDLVVSLLGPAGGCGAAPVEMDDRISELLPLLGSYASSIGAGIDYQPAGGGAGIAMRRSPFNQTVLNLARIVLRGCCRGRVLLRIEATSAATEVLLRLIASAPAAPAAPARELVAAETEADEPSILVARALTQQAGGRIALEPAADAWNGFEVRMTLPRVDMA